MAMLSHPYPVQAPVGPHIAPRTDLHAPGTYALPGALRSENSELTEKSEHSHSGAMLTESAQSDGVRTDDIHMSKAASKAQAHEAMVQGLRDAANEVLTLKGDKVWASMTAKLTAGFTTRHNDADANVFLYRVVFRNVYQDMGFPTIEQFYEHLAADKDASKKSIRNHFDNRRKLGAEFWGSVDGKSGKTPKPVVETVAIYLASIPAKIAIATATDEQAIALADGVNKAVNAVNALMARMDEARKAPVDESESEQVERTGTLG